MKVPGWQCNDGTPDEDHDWVPQQDWYGDPGVINGTCTFYFWRCEQCGKEDHDRPVEYADLANDDDW